MSCLQDTSPTKFRQRYPDTRQPLDDVTTMLRNASVGQGRTTVALRGIRDDNGESITTIAQRSTLTAA